ncbi:hypothetical protein F5X96DRAFT_629463 [Biscogniauxia mediterranea]|nr:hypothetical protein F5X96DRAFT_629463 [Biscogniauxia mediterranea]
MPSTQMRYYVVWEPTVGDFDHCRFIQEPGKKRMNPAMIRSFGNGTIPTLSRASLCKQRGYAVPGSAIAPFDFKALTYSSLLDTIRQLCRAVEGFSTTASMATPKGR